jgi:hypothetical protein
MTTSGLPESGFEAPAGAGASKAGALCNDLEWCAGGSGDAGAGAAVVGGAFPIGG